MLYYNLKVLLISPVAIFVKDLYKVYRRPGVEHGEVMRILSAKFAATKIDQQTG